MISTGKYFFSILFVLSSLGIRDSSYSRKTLYMRRHNPKSYLSKEELLSVGMTVWDLKISVSRDFINLNVIQKQSNLRKK